MFGWTFDPFVWRQEKATEYYVGPIVLGLQWVWAHNERGIVLFFGPWLAQLTFMREAMVPLCDVCGAYHDPAQLCLWL